MSWLRFFRRGRNDDELQKEIAVYLEEEVVENIARGMSRAEARRRAHLKLGNLQLVREELWRQNTILTVDSVARDLKHAARALLRSPGFAATAILTLALGLGANTAVFSLINSLIIRPLPVPRAEELALLHWSWTHDPGPRYDFSLPMLRALEKRHEAFQNVAAFSGNVFMVGNGSRNVEVPAALVSGQFFEVMQTPPLLGRTLTPVDDQPGGTSTGFGVVIGEAFWRTWFHSAPDVIGRRLTIANAPFTVVGVVPASFIGADPTRRPSIYAPLWAEPVIDAPYNNIASGYHSLWLRILVRRNPGISLAKANASLRAATNSILNESVPDAKWIQSAQSRHFLLTAETGSNGYSYLRSVFVKPLVAVFSLCGAMLLLACLNLASLLTARSAARERELATRLALGASRIRLIQQLMVESLLLALLGTAAGLIAAPAVSRTLATFVLGNNRAAVLDTALDIRVFEFIGSAAVLSTLLVGLIPALRDTSRSLNEQIKSGSLATSPRQHRRIVPQLLTGLEVGLSLVLVFGAGLLATSLARLYHTGLGFDPNGVINLGLNMGKQPLNGAALVRWYEGFGDALARLPGVGIVSFAAITPMSGSNWTADFHTPVSGGNDEALMNEISPAYFRTIRIPLISGRDFRWSDTAAAGRKIILNQTAATKLFPGQSAVGQQLTNSENRNSYEVIGVVGDIHYESIREPACPEAYLPITQSEDRKPSYTAVVRLDGALGPFARAAQSLAAQLAPEIPPPVILTMNSDIDESIETERMMALLAVFFASCALLVTAIGLYGTLAYSTARRTSEIGIRMALGAKRLEVVSLVLHENVWSTAGGALAGLVVALLVSRALGSFLYGTSVRDPWTLMGSAGILILIAGAASLVPALRAARLDPAQTLRME